MLCHLNLPIYTVTRNNKDPLRLYMDKSRNKRTSRIPLELSAMVQSCNASQLSTRTQVDRQRTKDNIPNTTILLEWQQERIFYGMSLSSITVSCNKTLILGETSCSTLCIRHVPRLQFLFTFRKHGSRGNRQREYRPQTCMNDKNYTNMTPQVKD